MQINKKVLLAALCMSFQGAIISMETTPTLNGLALEQEIGLKQHASHISQYLENFHPEKSKENILPLANWLVQQKSTITEAGTWNNLIKTLKGSIQIPPCAMLKFCQTHEADLVHILKITECNSERYHFTCSYPHMIAKIIIRQAEELQPDTNGEELFESIQSLMDKALLGLLSKTYVDASF